MVYVLLHCQCLQLLNIDIKYVGKYGRNITENSLCLLGNRKDLLRYCLRASQVLFFENRNIKCL